MTLTKNIKRIRNKADKAFKEAVIERYGLVCEACGAESTSTAHHFFPRSLYAVLRFDIENGIAIGIKCHFSHHHRGNPVIHQNIISKRGQEWYNTLLEKSREKRASFVGIGYYEEQIKKLTKNI